MQIDQDINDDAPLAPAAGDWQAFDLDDPSLYFNRELSLLQFQVRVLEEAQDEDNPLLERVKFLAIVSSNMDEFFMVRYAGLKQQVSAGVTKRTPDGRNASEALAEIRRDALTLLTEQRRTYHNAVHPLLTRAGIHVLDYAELTEWQRHAANQYFEAVLFPTLTPLAFDPGRPFPHISTLSLNLAVLIRDQEGKTRFARIKVPNSLPRLIELKRPGGNGGHRHYYVWMEQVIIANLARLFPGMTIIEAHPFRVVRDADFEIQELEADDLLESMQENVKKRQFGSVVLVAVTPDMPEFLRHTLMKNMAVPAEDMFTLKGPLGMKDLFALMKIDREELKDPLYAPVLPPAFVGNTRDIFSIIREGDRLIHHPYDSFRPVIDFLEQAADDPDVLAIKMTLYRVGTNAPVVQALLRARENEKQVAVLVELKARFDEESNIGWAQTLEKEGVHVIYGLLGLKTHAKVALVVRREGDAIRRYLHMATGNYNASTARLYTDIGFFTCDPALGADATDLFNYLTGYSAKTDYRKLLVAPVSFRQRTEALIEREIEHARAGREARLVFKMNSLVDQRMIQLLYQASQAGVTVDLNVRGICCLRPGVPGLSENIRVVSVVGRYLEHSRIFYYRNGGRDEVYMGSADLMPRNLDRRVEAVFPVEDPVLIARIRDEILATHFADTRKARILMPDGSYERVQPSDGAAPFNSQEAFMRIHAERNT